MIPLISSVYLGWGRLDLFHCTLNTFTYERYLLVLWIDYQDANSVVRVRLKWLHAQVTTLERVFLAWFGHAILECRLISTTNLEQACKKYVGNRM